MLVHDLGQACSECEQGLAGSGRAEQADKIDIGVHQGIEREILLAISRLDSPDRMRAAEIVIDDLQDSLAVGQAHHAKLNLIFTGQIQKLVRVPVFLVRQGDFVKCMSALRPRAQVGMALPEIRRQLVVSGIQQAEIIEGAVVFIVLGGNARDRGLDAQVDVLGDEYHRDIGMGITQRDDRGQNQVVWNVPLLAIAALGDLGLEIQAANPGGSIEPESLRQLQIESVLDLSGLVVLDQLIDETADLARVAGYFRLSLFCGVQFFQHGHRNEDVVLLEPEQGRRVVHQHVGVEYVDAFASSHARASLGGTEE